MGRYEPKEILSGGRCAWCGDDALYQAYHDNEWGKPVSDDRHLFELEVLEGAQAGLNWLTILRKREAYRKTFHNFAGLRHMSAYASSHTRFIRNWSVSYMRLVCR